eukprot:scaffold190865_cov28-Tisochrysis_lutea.AAC.2
MDYPRDFSYNRRLTQCEQLSAASTADAHVRRDNKPTLFFAGIVQVRRAAHPHTPPQVGFQLTKASAYADQITRARPVRAIAACILQLLEESVTRA